MSLPHLTYDSTDMERNDDSRAKPADRSKLKHGLPGTPEYRRRRIRAAIERHAETLRRLSR